jgi:chromosome segregation ATPase
MDVESAKAHAAALETELDEARSAREKDLADAQARAAEVTESLEIKLRNLDLELVESNAKFQEEKRVGQAAREESDRSVGQLQREVAEARAEESALREQLVERDRELIVAKEVSHLLVDLPRVYL